MRIFHPWIRQKLQRKLLVFICLALIVTGLVIWRHNTAVAPTATSTGQTQTETDSTSPPGFDKSQHSVNDPASLWVVVNKGRILPSNFVPELSGALRPDAGAAMTLLITDAKQAGYSLRLYSGYRSYSDQAVTYSGFVKRDGVAKTDTYSARPGYSEHQTGLAADLSATSGKCTLEICFGDLPEGQWLAANAHKYGFIIRYGKDRQNQTGYQYEPWHLRYVGNDLAAQINQTGETLEQFFGLPAYTDYPANPYQLKSGT